VSPELRTALRTAAEAGVSLTLPPALAIDLLTGSSEAPAPDAPPSADLDVAALAVRFGRAPSTVRQWLEASRFPGTYKLMGRDWRVPPASLAAFEEAERKRGAGCKSAVTPLRRGKTPDLGEWRKVGGQVA
jgi:hypothetical protein